MRILHFIDVPWDSGLAHYALVLAVGQKQEGHEVFISALPGEKPWNKAARLGLDTIPYIKLSKLAALRTFVQEKRIDVLNAHTGSTHTLAVAAAWGQRAAVVRTRSDARPVKQRPGSSLLYRRTQAVIGAARYISQSFIDTFRLPLDKVHTVYQGIVTPAAFPNHVPDLPVLGIVARLDPVKGHRYLIQAVSELQARYPRIQLKIAGQEENIKVSELRRLAERYDVKPRIEFLGFQDRVAEFMKECTIGVVASTSSEAVSRVALEWMAAGKPLVATSVGCLPEIVKDRVTGYLVTPQDVTSLAHGIDRVLSDPHHARTLALAGYERVKDQFTMDRFIHETQAVYDQAVRSLK